VYKYALNSVVKISMMFAKYFEYYAIILRGGGVFSWTRCIRLFTTSAACTATPSFDVRSLGLFCGWPSGLELVTRLMLVIRRILWAVFVVTWKLFFSCSTSICSALGALRLCATLIYYWHWHLHTRVSEKTKCIRNSGREIYKFILQTCKIAHLCRQHRP